jgi:hypothetical protein
MYYRYFKARDVGTVKSNFKDYFHFLGVSPTTIKFEQGAAKQIND